MTESSAGDNTLLIFDAISSGNLEQVSFVIENGADINLGNQDGNTPLTEAKGRHHRLSWLLNRANPQGKKLDEKSQAELSAISGIFHSRSNLLSSGSMDNSSIEEKSGDNDPAVRFG